MQHFGIKKLKMKNEKQKKKIFLTGITIMVLSVFIFYHFWRFITAKLKRPNQIFFEESQRSWLIDPDPK